jgi:hypothetical protein
MDAQEYIVSTQSGGEGKKYPGFIIRLIMCLCFFAFLVTYKGIINEPLLENNSDCKMNTQCGQLTLFKFELPSFTKKNRLLDQSLIAFLTIGHHQNSKPLIHFCHYVRSCNSRSQKQTQLDSKDSGRARSKHKWRHMVFLTYIASLLFHSLLIDFSFLIISCVHL